MTNMQKTVQWALLAVLVVFLMLKLLEVPKEALWAVGLLTLLIFARLMFGRRVP